MSSRPPFNWKLCLGLWSLVGLLLTAQAVFGIDPPAHLSLRTFYFQIVLGQVVRVILWTLLTPAVFALRRRIPVDGWWLPAGTILHLAFAICITVWMVQVRGVVWMILADGWVWWRSYLDLNVIVAQLSQRQLVDGLLYAGAMGAGYLVDLLQEKRTAEQRAFELQQQLSRHELNQEQLRRQLVAAELAALKHQLHPHFLFNALNAVTGLVRQGQNDDAVTVISKISHLLRAMLNGTGRAQVTLAQELEYIRMYLAIEAVRFGPRLQERLDVEESCQNALVPSLILQPLVENAIKHGIARRRSPGRVEITAAARADRLCLTVLNDPAEAAGTQHPPEGHGIGLATVRSRLEQTYGAAASLTYRAEPGASVTVAIDLPLRFEPATPSSP